MISPAVDNHDPDRQSSVTPAEMARRLDDLAAVTGNRAYARAAAALRQPPPGRSSIDDHAALAEARYLVASGQAQSEAHACRLVARTLGPKSSIRSTAERLRRKLRAEAK
jgi:hypothetical protein